MRLALVLFLLAFAAHAEEMFTEGEVAIRLLNMKIQHNRELSRLASQIKQLEQALEDAQERPQTCI